MTDLARTVATRQREDLLARARALADDPRVVTGLSWGIAALDRVLRALDGETDPDRLGLVEAPSRPAAQEGLFS